MMKIQIVGSGVVGYATGRGFTQKGHNVVFYDISHDRLSDVSSAGYITTKNPQSADVHFVCVPDLVIDSCVKNLLELRGLIVVRSTTEHAGAITEMMEKYDRHICHNPEFLRELTPLQDFNNPHRIVIGECCTKHGDLLEYLYNTFNSPVIRTDPCTSEFIKWMSNAHLSTLISFWNEAYRIIEDHGVDPFPVSDAVRLDPRISTYGTVKRGAFGGKCLPKDLDILISVCDNAKIKPHLLEAVRVVNEQEKEEGRLTY